MLSAAPRPRHLAACSPYSELELPPPPRRGDTCRLSHPAQPRGGQTVQTWLDSSQLSTFPMLLCATMWRVGSWVGRDITSITSPRIMLQPW